MLDYVALGLLFFVAITLFYGIIAIHDIPYEISKHRNHPQQDAIHVAGWVSLFTLHVLWPFLWIWATLYREDRGWGFQNQKYAEEDESESLKNQLADLQERFNQMEKTLSETSRSTSNKTQQTETSATQSAQGEQ
ncbi:MAG: DUF3302 domain-containing protein [gamma proteobacterium symbiont of Taylorina sp.]|nr:DUF3302 domain-containing protein [gamma proteobacterium symbiont of Taylorina sp.]